MKRSLIISFLLLYTFLVSYGQDFNYKIPFRSGGENRFYKIELLPEILSKARADLGDIRSYDEKKREVPYLLERTQAIQNQQYFREYPLLEKTSKPGVSTTLVVRNQSRKKINNLGILLKNTNVTKKAGLSGSPDGKSWYALENNYIIQTVANPQETSEVRVLNFPLSDYEFYRLEINDSASAPLNILAVGYYDFKAEAGEYYQLANLNLSQTDSSEVKASFLKFKFPEPVLIDKLVFEVDSTTFYRRNATVFERQLISGRRGRKYYEMVPVQSFEISAANSNAILLNGFRSAEFFVMVENGDNPPLGFKNARALQLKTYLLAELKRNKLYELKVGNDKATKPVYDLEYFKEKIPQNSPVLIPEEIISAKKSEASENQVNNFFQNKLLIWAAILTVIAFLSFMTWQMLREADKTKN